MQLQCLDAGLERCCLAFSRLCLLHKGVYAVLGIALSRSAITCTKLPVDGIRPIVDLHQDCYEAATGLLAQLKAQRAPQRWRRLERSRQGTQGVAWRSGIPLQAVPVLVRRRAPG